MIDQTYMLILFNLVTVLVIIWYVMTVNCCTADFRFGSHHDQE